MRHLRKFPFKTVPILPEVYGDTLSYMELLGKTVAKLNEIIDYINEFEEEILAEAKAYTDSRFDELGGEIDFLRNDITEFKNEINNQVGNLRNWTEREIANLSTYINNKILQIQNSLDWIIDDYTAKLLEQKSFLIDYINRVLQKEINVVNYFTGRTVSIQSMCDFLAMLHIEDPLYVGTISSYNESVDTIAGATETALNWILHGKEILESL